MAYETTVIQKADVPESRMPGRLKYAFLKELAAKLESNQALRVDSVPFGQVGSLMGAWRYSCKGREPHTFSQKQKDGNYTLYLWLGKIE